ncbi:AraC-type DNA-binding protein [Dyadobacter sp. SG02]|uniref:AraC family transcriptional regulator n=1 Tax=Dyadobacter sp. SG02 TaxID=1855291 RepID=UPI0008AF6E9A|nr:helix-turn-helix domain-containing protein [Dyadobacter sp. SG02]SEI52820.1 AraC-type DNA-binding protein [Dyadobacter sp. SG02]
MILKHSDSRTGGQVVFVQDEPDFQQTRKQARRYFTLCINRGESQTATIDGIAYPFPSRSILPLFSHESFAFEHSGEIIAWQYNRDFYCIIDHDSEVGCAGFLFFGSFGNLFIMLDEERWDKIELLRRIFIEELKTNDGIQTDMLRLLLKRLIIIATRLGKKQYANQLPDTRFHLIRQYNILVEKHFKEEHEVQFYAAELHKSPKTISNLFARSGQRAPLRIIHDRIILEAKKLILYTDKSSKEIAHALGFEDAGHFSHFFKNVTGQSITSLRKDK